jgi:hypothetical protein
LRRAGGAAGFVRSALRRSGEAQPFVEALALREMDRVVADSSGAERGDGEVRRQAPSDGADLGGFRE